MADKRISQLIERTDIANNDVLPIVASGATTTNKVTISTIQDWMQDNLDVGVTSVGITIGSTGTDVNVSGSPITTSGNITINIPTASATARGLVSTGTQTFAGYKIFTGTIGVNQDIQLATQGTALNTFIKNINATGLTSIGSNGFGFNNANNIYFSGSSKGGGVFAFSNTGTQTYTLQDASGTLAFTSDLSGYVTLDTAQTITATKTFTTSGSANTININHTSGSGHGVEITKAGNGEGLRVIKTSGSGNAVTITGGLLSAEGVSVNTPSNGIGVLINGRTSDNLSQIRFGANTGGGQYNSISANASSLDISSLGNTPITFGTNNSGGGGTRMTIGGDGTVTLAGALNGTSAAFNGSVVTEGVVVDGANNANISQFAMTRTDSSWGIFNETDLRIYNSLSNTTTPTNLRFTLSSAGVVTLTGALNGTSASFNGNVTSLGFRSNSLDGFVLRNNANTLNLGGITRRSFWAGGSSEDTQIFAETGYGIFLNTGGSTSSGLSLASTGAATFSSSVTINGTGNPALDVQGTAIIRGNGSAYATHYFTTSAANVAQYDQYDASGNIKNRLRADGNSYITGGNVGIGTASPSVKFQVSNAASGNIALFTNTTDADLLVNLTSGVTLLSPSTGTLALGTSSTERMRITSGGYLKASNDSTYVAVGSNFHEFTASQNGTDAFLVRHKGTDPYGSEVMFTGASPNNTSNWFFYASDATNSKFIVYSNGNVVNRNNSYGAISDAKLKENIEDATPKLDDLMKVKVRNYNLIGDDKKQIGVIAQELEEVFPAMIDESEDFEEVEVPQVDEEGNEVLNEEGEVVTEKQRVSKGTTTKSVKYSVFVPMLIKAMQEQQEQIKSLTEQVEALKSQING